jgi:hypothetical protein
MFGSLLKAAVGVVVTPVAMVADVVTLNTDPKKKSLTEQTVDDICKNVDKALSGD